LLTQQFEHSGGVIAANTDEGTGVEPVQRCVDIGACARIWFVAGRAERRIGRVAEAAELGLGDVGQVDDVARREASHAIARAQNAQGRIKPARGKDGATQGLVDRGGGGRRTGR
jgi:hypothetical protein